MWVAIFFSNFSLRRQRQLKIFLTVDIWDHFLLFIGLCVTVLSTYLKCVFLLWNRFSVQQISLKQILQTIFVNEFRRYLILFWHYFQALLLFKNCL